MFLVKKELKREEIANKIDIFYRDKDNQDNILKLIKFVENEIHSYKYKSNKDYMLLGRKKALMSELEEILNKYDENKYSFSKDEELIRVLLQFITEGNRAYPDDVDKSKWVDGKMINNSDLKELRDKCDRYTLCGVICLEEKQDILNMIDVIKQKYK